MRALDLGQNTWTASLASRDTKIKSETWHRGRTGPAPRCTGASGLWAGRPKTPPGHALAPPPTCGPLLGPRSCMGLLVDRRQSSVSLPSFDGPSTSRTGPFAGHLGLHGTVDGPSKDCRGPSTVQGRDGTGPKRTV
ncbi:hypothetical protein M885DRAFT_2737 [Pelagophyceae sp. CCMP2097]|nr:hypothetical protein M885DRAFT_2737 [Pelagophyceae sp. CCMP2097]